MSEIGIACPQCENVDNEVTRTVVGWNETVRERVCEYCGAKFKTIEENIRCRGCGCGHSPVLRTTKLSDNIRRTRQCRNCGKRYNSTENSEEEKKQYM